MTRAGHDSPDATPSAPSPLMPVTVRPSRSTRLLLAAFVLPYVLLGLVWVMANPAMAAPDENDHLVKALGLARLDVGATMTAAPADDSLGALRNASITRVVEISGVLDPTAYRCFAFDTAQTAACQPERAAGPGLAPVPTTLGAYPPFLYPPLGWVASVGADPVQADRLGRLVVLAVGALLLRAAAGHLLRWLGPRSLVGVAVAMTPMAIFCLGVLSTSAVEVLGAMIVAAVVAVQARRPESLAVARTQGLVLVAGTLLVLSRQLGIVTLALLLALLLALGGWREVWTGLRSGRVVTWTTVLALGVATAAVGVWELRFDHPVLLGPWVSAESLRGFVAQGAQLVQETVGWFGWLDVRPPGPLNVIWVGAAVLLVATALVVGDRRDRVVLLGSLVAAVVVAYVTYARVFFPIGAQLQGRHVLPILAVVPIWSGLAVAERVSPRLLQTAGRLAAVALPLVVLGGLFLNGQRYAVGLTASSGLTWFVPSAQWTPPGGWPVWMVLAVVGAGGIGLSWVLMTRVVRTAPFPD